jgi:hypothetical protein
MSKKIILISVLTAGFLFSCQKQTFTPRERSSSCSHETTSTRGLSTDDIDQADVINVVDAQVNASKYDGSITDPNNDEDRGKKKKGNN